MSSTAGSSRSIRGRGPSELMWESCLFTTPFPQLFCLFHILCRYTWTGDLAAPGNTVDRIYERI